MYAIMRRNSDLVNLLINAGANVNAKDKFGTTALYVSMFYKCEEITDILIKAGTNDNT